MRITAPRKMLTTAMPRFQQDLRRDGRSLGHTSRRKEKHMNDFMRGVVDTGRLVTLAAVTGYFLFLTVRVVESRRWR